MPGFWIGFQFVLGDLDHVDVAILLTEGNSHCLES